MAQEQDCENSDSFLFVFAHNRTRFLFMKRKLIERFHLDDRGAVIIANPEGDRRRRVVGEHSPYARIPWQEVVNHS